MDGRDVLQGMLGIGKTKVDEFVVEATELLSQWDKPNDDVSPVAERAGSGGPAAGGENLGASSVWGELPSQLPHGHFRELGRSTSQTHRWGDGTVEEFDDFIRFRGKGGFEGLQFAVGLNSKHDVVGFLLGASGGSKRALTYFFRADDWAQSYEMLSMIRGGGATGKAGFGPDDPVPTAYQGFKIDVLKNRIGGKWNVLAVVAERDDYATMLRHTFLQAKLRRLI